MRQLTANDGGGGGFDGTPMLGQGSRYAPSQGGVATGAEVGGGEGTPRHFTGDMQAAEGFGLHPPGHADYMAPPAGGVDAQWYGAHGIYKCVPPPPLLSPTPLSRIPPPLPRTPLPWLVSASRLLGATAPSAAARTL